MTCIFCDGPTPCDCVKTDRAKVIMGNVIDEMYRSDVPDNADRVSDTSAPPAGSTAGILAATQELKKQPVPTFNGLRVVEDKTLPPMGVVIHVGSEYLRKLKEQGR